MKKITNKNKYNLKKGMIIGGDGVEDIILTSDYLPYHSGYTYHNTEINNEGDLVELETGHITTASELVGYYYY